MKLYNTLTRQIDDFQPLQAPYVSVYTCGPTVYDYAHIGHWFNYVRMDTLIRVLNLNGYDTDWVMNITDVGHLVSDADDGEDKLEKGARREGKTAWEVAEFYTKDFLDTMGLLHIKTPQHITKATDHIAEQKALVETLDEMGYTYTIDDGIYYDTSKFEGYAAFARLDLDGIQAGARVDYNSQKRNPADFALWKFSPAGEKRDMEWNNPLGIAGKGFPGWHIECSAMAMKYLGATLDIHCGGIDHIPVHHTNEIAQSEAATGQRFANYWLHSNHVMVDGAKISKSLGNGIRLQRLLSDGFTVAAIRLYILESHYRTQSQFSLDGLQAATNRLQSLQAMAVLRFQSRQQPISDPTFALATVGDELIELLSNDLNTPAALSFISQLDTQLQTTLVQSGQIEAFEALLQTIDDALGLQLLLVGDINKEQKQLINDREQARETKDWAKSDELRDRLATDNISLRDNQCRHHLVLDKTRLSFGALGGVFDDGGINAVDVLVARQEIQNQDADTAGNRDGE